MALPVKTQTSLYILRSLITAAASQCSPSSSIYMFSSNESVSVQQRPWSDCLSVWGFAMICCRRPFSCISVPLLFRIISAKTSALPNQFDLYFSQNHILFAHFERFFSTLRCETKYVPTRILVVLGSNLRYGNTEASYSVPFVSPTS